MKHEFKVGDKVRIRQWDDMVKEFGVDSDEDIKCNRSFTKGMKHLCGRTATIINTYYGDTIELKNWSNDTGILSWEFTIDMIEPAEPIKPLIMIYQNRKNPNETIAVRKNGNVVVDTAKAIYNPIYEKDGDTYSFEKGAEIAVKRLLGIKVEYKSDSFDWDGFKQGNFAVRCDTEDKANAFLEECDKHGIAWSSGEKATSYLNYEMHREDTAFCICNGALGFAQYILYRDEWKKKIVDYQLVAAQNPKLQKTDLSSCNKEELLAELDRRL